MMLTKPLVFNDVTNMDRISRLPDDVICHILSFLPTKYAVATSVLSSRWVNLWSVLPIIDLDDWLYLDLSRKNSGPWIFLRFLNRVLSLNQSQTIVKFRLYMHRIYMNYRYGQTLSGINGFIQNVFLRNVVEVDFGIFSLFSDYDDHSIKIPHSESLRVLKVRTDYFLKMPVFPGCFPSLRVFDVNAYMDKDDEWITNLFPCLHALEKLSLVGDLADTGEFNFNIGGPVLKHLELKLMALNYDECDAVVVIDAPKLDYLMLHDTILASYLVKHKPAISEVRLQMGEGVEFIDILDALGPLRLPRFTELLLGLVNTKFISVSASTLKVLFSQYVSIPVLPYLTKMELEVPASSWILLLYWLQSCPNLKVLSLIMKEEIDGEESEEEEWMVPNVVPSCLSSRIKEIEIKRLGKADEEEMLKYLLDNAKVLDRFTVDSRVVYI